MRYPGGAEIELSMLVAEIRAPGDLAEGMSAADFERKIDRFYRSATLVLIRTDAFIDKLVREKIVGVYLPLFTGPNHARAAIGSAQELLYISGHRDTEGPWLPMGIGIHTGVAYVGVVSGADGTVTDITALGDNVTAVSQLATSAETGEAQISSAAFDAASMDLGDLETRRLALKGKSESVDVRVLRL